MEAQIKALMARFRCDWKIYCRPNPAGSGLILVELWPGGSRGEDPGYRQVWSGATDVRSKHNKYVADAFHV